MTDTELSHAPAPLSDDVVYMGRQPIFDRNKKTIAYQLLHRSSETNAANPDEAEHATRELVEHTLLQWGLDTLLSGKVGHVHVDARFLASGLHLALPAERVVLQLAADVDIDGDHRHSVIEAKLAGYQLALSDVAGRAVPPTADMLQLADIIKVDVTTLSVDQLGATVQSLRAQAPRAHLLAEKVEELEQYRVCQALGFDLFQGFFFAKPEVLTKEARTVSSGAAIALLVEVQQPNVSLRRLEQLVVADPSLAFRLLALVNSSMMGLTTRVESVYHALVLLGIDRVRQLATLITMSTRSKGNEELLNLAATRAYMAKALIDDHDLEHSAYTAGLLSVIDVLFQISMADLVNELPLAPVVADGLRDRSGPIGAMLQAIDAYERVDLPRLEQLRQGQLARFITVYREGVAYAQTMRAALAAPG
jgi:EAL and modified HD-GYP domain-containing signal transduction protein